MSSEPPSGKRPTGPPSGPLSGRGSQPPGPSEEPEATRQDWPSQPSGPSGPQEPPGPPAPPSGGRGTPAERPGGGAPWWRSKAALAAAVAVVVIAAALTVFLMRQSGTPAGEVFLQAASADGRDPFTHSSAKGSSAAAAAAPAHPQGTGNGPRTVQGSTPGLYGGTRNVASCDVERQIGYLNQDQSKARAFAGAAGIEAGGLATYLRGLTPLQLRTDTRVTNHGYKDGSVTSFQSVLQAGTAVLVDDRGVPRVRCACGNPLKPPVAVKGTPKAKGDTWPAYRPEDVVVVDPADSVMEVIVVYDPETREWFERPVGTDGEEDRPISAPKGGMTTQPPRPATSPGGQQPQQPPQPPKPQQPTAPHPMPPATTPHTTPPTTPAPQMPPPPAYGPPPARPNG
ncbi:DUF6777 domain-containing protein [Streptomyces triculaminicus]|uniref:DUF6777 domain-containing protein n=1 Tax=Streptomyces triculaminicus TaxID=2816232 RepID=UPI0037D2090A